MISHVLEIKRLFFCMVLNGLYMSSVSIYLYNDYSWVTYDILKRILFHCIDVDLC